MKLTVTSQKNKIKTVTHLIVEGRWSIWRKHKQSIERTCFYCWANSAKHHITMFPSMLNTKISFLIYPFSSHDFIMLIICDEINVIPDKSRLWEGQMVGLTPSSEACFWYSSVIAAEVNNSVKLLPVKCKLCWYSKKYITDVKQNIALLECISLNWCSRNLNTETLLNHKEVFEGKC